MTTLTAPDEARSAVEQRVEIARAEALRLVAQQETPLADLAARLGTEYGFSREVVSRALALLLTERTLALTPNRAVRLAPVGGEHAQ